mgnify:CR=1 FL=1
MTAASSVSASGPTSKRGFDLPRKSRSEQGRARSVLQSLYARYPDAKCALHFRNPYELLVATILSAQATDVSVNQATPGLFERFPEPSALAAVEPEAVEPYIRTIGLFRSKAKSLVATSRALVGEHGGVVPREMESLTALRGVARKTANVVLGNAYGINVGVVVDTHVRRLSQRFGLTAHEDVNRIERDLMALFPRREWTMLSHLLIEHGRAVCKARGASCGSDSICRRFCSNASGG